MTKMTSNKEIIYNKPVIKVIGLGGGGSNAVDRMVSLGYQDIEFIAANTDAQALIGNNAPQKILLGAQSTRGMGSGGDPQVGEAAAIESADEIRAVLRGADIVFLAAGMGGGTGSGAISIAAEIAHELGAITISIVNTPFSFEAGQRLKNARTYLSRLAAHSDTMIAIPNDQLLKIRPKNFTLKQSFAFADDVLRQGVFGISQLLTGVGEINVDFAHIRRMMMNGGGSILTIGHGQGPDKVSQAIYQAINHPLLEHLPIENATGIIANFTGNENLSFMEVAEGMGYLQQLTNHNAEIIPGQVVDNRLNDEVQIILIITGMASTPLESAKPENILKPQKIEPLKVVDTKIERLVELRRSEMAFAYIPQTVGSFAEDYVEQTIPSSVALSKTNSSPLAEAAFDTFMSPLGLNGFETSTTKVMSENKQNDTVADLDIPTFIRRKM